MTGQWTLILVFGVTWFGIIGVWWLLEQRRQRMRDRLARVIGFNVLEEEQQEETHSAKTLLPTDVTERLRGELWRAGLEATPATFVGATAAAAVVGALIGVWLTRTPVGALGGAALGIAGALGVLHWKQGQRRAKFEAQLSDALTMIASSLRSGYSFQQALQVVSREMAAPMSTETNRVMEEIAVGMPLEDALQRLVDRVRSYDVELLTTAISIQHQVGGNLAELLDTIAETLRERFRGRQEISALTAEGRLSGVILFLLPLGLLGVLLIKSPDYLSPLFENPIGRTMLIGALVMQCVGGLILKKMLTVDV